MPLIFNETQPETNELMEGTNETYCIYS